MDGLVKGRNGFKPKPFRHWKHALKPTDGVPRFVTHEQYVADIQALLAMLPPNIASVAGVARSGVFPASLIAMLLHVPLTIIRHHQADWFPAGNGWRLDKRSRSRKGPTLIVDDTVLTGNSMKRTRHVTQDMPGEKLYAAVYVNPSALEKPDLWAVDLPAPHLLEWNCPNSLLSQNIATDFDGILCRDCTADEDDEADRYLRFLETAEPLYLFRKAILPMIVTARLERYRPQTEAWLRRWGVRTRKLVMGPWRDNQQRRQSDVAAFKARHFKTMIHGKSTGIRPQMFWESDPRQAERIARLSGGLVVCPTAGRCFWGET